MKLKKFNFKIINSTNDRAFQIIKKTNNKSGIVIAEKQKRGRGQYGKKWTSFKGNLFVSIFFQVNMVQLSLHNLTKINCLLVKKLLSNFYKDKIVIDHIIEIKDGGDRLNQDNLQTLCLPHHNQKTAWAKAKRKRNGKE